MILPLCIGLYGITIFLAILHCMINEANTWLKSLSALAFVTFFVAASAILSIGWWLNTLTVPASVYFRAPAPIVEFDI